jgi:hypothetical protein
MTHAFYFICQCSYGPTKSCLLFYHAVTLFSIKTCFLLFFYIFVLIELLIAFFFGMWMLIDCYHSFYKQFFGTKGRVIRIVYSGKIQDWN